MTRTDDSDGVLPIIAVVGPTATGKSDLALDICEALRGEVVNADAMQLYRGMDIGTAKLSEGERHGIPHHLLDVLEVTDEASVALYQRDSRRAIDGIREQGITPVVVGGSGLYVRAALDHLTIPPTNPAVRSAIERRAEDIGTAGLYAVLQLRDPVAAAAIQPRNRRRIVRALEVIELTGEPFSATLPRREFVTTTVMIGLDAEPRMVDERIDQRVERMWTAGLCDEVRALERHGLRDGRTASHAIGYAQALAQLDGNLTAVEAVASTQQATRRLARRQRSWFRPDPRITWFDSATPSSEIVRWVRQEVRNNGGHG